MAQYTNGVDCVITKLLKQLSIIISVVPTPFSAKSPIINWYVLYLLLEYGGKSFTEVCSE